MEVRVRHDPENREVRPGVLDEQAPTEMELVAVVTVELYIT